ncbi:hypothetical protein KSD_52530 [Ktedonobacter sp. SOSP1-85]|uniref:ATP-binding protein n=1 Tax=Ktedonobacter sp. SOSP1-85 TaxID=2778367 RepID=UPI0019168691|nr:ATP-binding protein [Ktedonobacter sp. SOSP1-85]GHO77482.1 hypothetical protein KSD_52530 [Ktedonobacter sp. SOSP1-85]
MPGEQSISTSNEEHIRLRNALRESELLRELSELLASSLDPTHILQVLVRRTTEVCEVQRCAVWLLDEAQTSFLPSAYHLNASSFPPKALQAADHVWHRSRFPFHDPIVQHLVQQQPCLALSDLASTPSSHMRLLADKFLVRSILLIALLREGKPVGIMSLDNPQQETLFSAEQQQLARAIGQQAALTIHNARLYQQAQSERKRAERLIQRARSIYQVAMAVNSGEELATVLHIATQHLQQGFGTGKAAIALLSQDTTLTVMIQGESTSSTPSEGPHLPALSHCQQAATTGKTYFIPSDQATPHERAWFQQLGFEQVLVAPLMGNLPRQHSRRTARGETSCLGLALIGFPLHARAPSQGYRAFALDIAAQCALAIEKDHILQEARQAAALANERANTLDAIFNAMSEGILVLDMQGEAILSNHMARRYLETSFDAQIDLSKLLQHRHISTLRGKTIPPERFPIVRALRGEYIRGERYVTTSADGSERTMEINVEPLLDDQQQQIGIVSAFRDISEQIRSERRVRRALDTMLHAAEAASGLTNLHDMLQSLLGKTLASLHCDRGMVQLYNQEQHVFEPYLSIGFAPEEEELWQQEQQTWLMPTKGQYTGFREHLLAGHALQVSAEQCPEQPNPFAETMLIAAPIMHRNDLHGVILLDRSTTLRREQHPQEGATRPLRHPVFNVWDLAVAEGIAQFAGLAMEQMHWQKEATLARTSEELMRQSNDLKDEFLDITAHEFRTPLTIIVAHSQMMARLLRKHQLEPVLQDKLHESIATIDQQGHQLTNIVNTFLEVTRLNRGQIVLNTEELDVQRIVERTVAEHAMTSPMHTITCQVQTGAHPYLILGDSARLSQVFANLLQNAIKYSPFGGSITVTLQQTPNASGDPFVEIRIQDQGIGIPLDAQARLFERFYRAPNIEGNKTRGVGLGLYVVAQFLSLHGGHIGVESSGIPGEGTCFILTLPLVERSDIIEA